MHMVAKPRLVVAGFVALDVLVFAVAVLAALIPDLRAYLVLAFPAIVVTANRLLLFAVEILDELGDVELLALGIAYPVAIAASLIASMVYVYDDLYYFLIAILTYYIMFLSLPDCGSQASTVKHQGC
jgi:hypothetical protein